MPNSTLSTIAVDTISMSTKAPRTDANPDLTPGCQAESSLESVKKDNDRDSSTRKRSLFRMGRKKEDKKPGGASAAADVASRSGSRPNDNAGDSSDNAHRSALISPYVSRSPDRPLSPAYRAASPAGSQIFERDVQDSAFPGPIPASPAVPGHLQVDDHIPSVLDASSEAITNSNLSPDEVEIVMHTAHQPAVAAVAGNPANDSLSNSWVVDLSSSQEMHDSNSRYGAIDASDVRRLSFISFADVVQSEHTEQSGAKDHLHNAGLTSLASRPRSPSPMLSLVSSQGPDTSTPTSKSASVGGSDLSPPRSPQPLASPTLSTCSSGSSGSDLMIQTMSQALQKTQSGEVGGVKSTIAGEF